MIFFTFQMIREEKVLISINVWPGNGIIGFGGNVGHGSLTCGSTYMSWWPASGSVGMVEGAGHMILGRRAPVPTVVSGATETLSTDVASEGNRVPNTYRFSGVFDEAAILQAWLGWTRIGTYNLAERSCCSCVVTLLEFGGLARVIPNYTSYLSASLAGRRVVTPNDLITVARAIETSQSPERAPSMSAGGGSRITH